MSGRKAYDRDSYLADVLLLRKRGRTWQQISAQLGISVRTLHRMVKGQ